MMTYYVGSNPPTIIGGTIKSIVNMKGHSISIITKICIESRHGGKFVIM